MITIKQIIVLKTEMSTQWGDPSIMSGNKMNFYPSTKLCQKAYKKYLKKKVLLLSESCINQKTSVLYDTYSVTLPPIDCTYIGHKLYYRIVGCSFIQDCTTCRQF